MKPIFCLAVLFIGFESERAMSQTVTESSTSLSADQLFQPDHIVDIQIDLPPESWDTVWYKRTPGKTAGLGQVTIDLHIGCEPVEFGEIGVFAERSKWPSGDKVKPASIVITGKRKSDGRRLTIGMFIADVAFHPTGDSQVDIGGILLVDNAFVDSKGRMRMIAGSVKLTEASTEDGQPVRGVMEVAIMKLMGGYAVEDADEDKEKEK